MSDLQPIHFIGEIVHAAFDYAPKGYFPCDGHLMPINEYPALFSLLRTRFGGNGTTHFALPNYNPSAPRESMYVICNIGIFPSNK